MNRSSLLFFLTIFFLTGCFPFTGRTTDVQLETGTSKFATNTQLKSTEPAFDLSSLNTIKTDITYCTPDHLPQKLDVYFPANLTESPWPMIVYIHGGSWSEGDKENARYLSVIPALQNAGFMVAAINYRLAPQHPFPAQIQDSRCAIRYLRDHAKEYNINPLKVGALGDSAGGHIVALLGLADSNLAWDTAEYSAETSQVQAVVDLYGISDLTRVFEGSGIWQSVFNADQRTDTQLKFASPLTYVHPDAPPFLLIHGDQDRLVPFEQSQRLFDSMKAAGNIVDLVTVKNAGHNFAPTGVQPVDPDQAEIDRLITTFFISHLK